MVPLCYWISTRAERSVPSPAFPGRPRGSRGFRSWAACAMSSRCRSSWCELVREPVQRLLFRELVGRYHYLGHTVPLGAHLRYRPVVDSFGTLVLVSSGRDARVRGGGGRVGDGIVTAELGFAGSSGARLEAGCSFGWNLLGLVGATHLTTNAVLADAGGRRSSAGG